MKYIISGTNRRGSRSLQVAQLIQRYYKELGEDVEIMDLVDFQCSPLDEAPYPAELPENLAKWVNKVNLSEGLIVVCPEYNGSYPGILKYFIDHWKYPESFEYRPVCLVGLGGRFGGLRPVEHLQQVFNYRNSYIFPERVFVTNVWQVLVEGELKDELLVKLLRQQASGFQKFVSALKTAQLGIFKS